MKVTRKFQMGGEMPEQQMDPAMEQEMAQGGGEQGMEGSPEEQLMMMAEEIINQLGPEAAMMLAEAIAQMLQGGGGGEPGMEQPMPEEQPMYQRKGGRLVRLPRS